MATRRKPSQQPKSPAPPASVSATDGVLLVDKEAGPTSHDVVDRVRRVLGMKRVGHGGTLDPQATGLLIILVGRGTKLSNHFIASDKVYEGVLHLGISTDTQDAEGKVVREADFSSVTREQLESTMRERTGDMYQTPPMVSAVKVDGVPLYKRARRGETVEREPRLIHVYDFSLRDFDPPRAAFQLTCTKGTYVRTLCSDIGDALGCGAYLEELRRVRCGNLDVGDGVPGENLRELSPETLRERIIPLERARLL